MLPALPRPDPRTLLLGSKRMWVEPGQQPWERREESERRSHAHQGDGAQNHWERREGTVREREGRREKGERGRERERERVCVCVYV